MPIDPNLGSATGIAGSSNNAPDSNSSGQASIEELQKRDEQIHHLEKKLGEQGGELGELRTFFQNISPVLEKLDASPEMVQAIVEGRIDADIARAALQNNLSVGDVKVLDKAHNVVKKELGKEGYAQASADDIAKLVASEVGKVRQEMDAKMSEQEELRNFESSVVDFINRTPDFGEYATEIDRWMDSHSDITDISTAYYAVKGQLSERKAQKQAQEDATNYAKQMAGMTGGGSNRSNYVPSGSSLVDDLISGRSNPNTL